MTWGENSFFEAKTSNIYSELISGNVDEKSRFVTELIASNDTPRVNGKIMVLEVGVGGGETARGLADDMKGTEVEVYGIDLSQLFLKNAGIPGAVGNAANMPFQDRSFSIINASAVLHEVASYGIAMSNGHRILGLEAVKKCLNEFHRVLAPGGLVCYRDLFCPEDKYISKERVYSPILKDFLYKFLVVFQPTFKNMYPESFCKPSFSVTSDSKILITATEHFHQEIQRHLVTYILYAAHSHKITPKEFVEKRLSIDDTQFLEAWLKREGNEVYTYLSLKELSSLMESLSFETQKTDIVHRDEYEKLLIELIQPTMFDAKQMAVFQAIDRK